MEVYTYLYLSLRCAIIVAYTFSDLKHMSHNRSKQEDILL